MKTVSKNARAIIIFLIVICSLWAFRSRNPYYNANPGSAVLSGGKQINGMFYMHNAPFSGKVQFYFYPEKSPSNHETYNVSDLRELTIRNPKDPGRFKVFINKNDTLYYMERDSSLHMLTRKIYNAI